MTKILAIDRLPYFQGENLKPLTIVVPRPPDELIDDIKRCRDRGPYYNPATNRWFKIEVPNNERGGH